MQDISYAVSLQQTLFISSLIYMTAADTTDFQAYLQTICADEKYQGWQDFYTPTDALHRQRIEKKQPPRRLNLSLMVQTIVPPRETEASGREKAEK